MSFRLSPEERETVSNPYSDIMLSPLAVQIVESKSINLGTIEQDDGNRFAHEKLRVGFSAKIRYSKLRKYLKCLIKYSVEKHIPESLRDLTFCVSLGEGYDVIGSVSMGAAQNCKGRCNNLHTESNLLCAGRWGSCKIKPEINRALILKILL